MKLFIQKFGANFKPTFWSKYCQTELAKDLVIANWCDYKFEGEIQHGKRLEIVGAVRPTVKKYTEGVDIEIETLGDASQHLDIEFADYFAFYVDDVDQAQSVPGLMERYQEKAVHGLAVARDTYVANLIKGATNATTATGNDAEAVKEALDNAIVALRERNFDEAGVIEITPAVYNVFKNYLITLSTNNPELIKKGVVGKYDDFDVIMSNNMAKDSSHVYCDIRGKKAIAFAGQINEVEALRAEKRFKDIVRGLDTFGAKVIDEARIQVVKVPV